MDNPEKVMTEIEVARRTQKESVFTIQKEITREIVKIKCPYCGMLVEHTLSRCPNCNGLIK
jgi:rubrerythrin